MQRGHARHRVTRPWWAARFALRSAFPLLASLAGIEATAQTASYTVDADWESGPSLRTKGLAVADMNLDGRLDLLCANFSDESSLYLGTGSTLSLVPLGGLDRKQARAVASGDVDGDGDPDFVLGCDGENLLYLNLGGGRADSVWSSVPVWATRDVALADIDLDGDLDLVCANTGAPNTIYRNLGERFETDPFWRTDSSHATTSVAVGRVDPADPFPDVVFGNDGARTLYLNQDGTPATTPDWTGGPTANTTGVALGDLDGDGLLDLVCVNDPAENAIYLNTGSEFSTTPSFFGPPSPTTSLALGDLDKDGDLDVVCGNRDVPNAVYLNGGGVLVAAWSSSSSDNTTSAILADIDGDNLLDLVFGNDSSGNTAHLNTAIGFASSRAWSSDPMTTTRAVALGDVDDDGDVDLVCGNAGQTNHLYRNDASESVFAATPAWVAPDVADEDNTRAVALGDVDGDGFLDLVCGNSGERDLLFSGDGTTFSGAASWRSDSSYTTRAVGLGDLDGDGDLDLVSGNSLGTPTEIYWNDGGKLSTSSTWKTNEPNSTLSLALGDVNDDGALDLVLGNTNSPSRLYLNVAGELSTGRAWASADTPATEGVALGDIDGDGDVDLLCGNRGAKNVLYENIGGTFGSAPIWFSGTSNTTYAAALVDVDGDGDLDAVFGNDGEDDTFFENLGGSLSTVPRTLGPAAARSYSVAAADVDRDGDQDLVFGVNLASNELFLGTRAPVFQGDPADPADHLPNNGAFLHDVRIRSTSPNLLDVEFQAVDVESDSILVVSDARFRGHADWFAIDAGEPARCASSPEGVPGQVEWDTFRFPTSSRSVVLRLRTIAFPRAESTTRHVASYEMMLDPLTPARPRLVASATSLSLGPVSQGDSTSTILTLRNAGNQDLQISEISHLSPEVYVTPSAALIAAGDSLLVTVTAAPVTMVVLADTVRVRSNDPFDSAFAIPLSVEVLAFRFTARPLIADEEIEWGAPLPILVSPSPGAIEEGSLYYRRRGVAEFDSVALTSVDDSGAFLGILPGEVVNDAVLEWYVAAQNHPVSGTDPPGAPQDSLFTIPSHPPPEVIAQPQPNALGGSIVAGTALSILIDLDGVSSGTLHYRRGGETEYRSVPFDVEPSIPSAQIPASDVGERGIEFWVEVTALGSLLTDPPVEPFDHPRVISVEVDNLEEAGSHAGAVYRMVSVPLDFRSPNETLVQILSDQSAFGPYDPNQWRSFRHHPGEARYVEVTEPGQDEFLSLQPGRGFWLVCRVENRIDTDPVDGYSPPTQADYPVPLDAGWNQIGNPFPFPVAWSSVLSSPNVGAPVAYDTATDEYAIDAPDVLRPFEGYFIRADAPDTLWVEPIEADAESVGSIAPVPVPATSSEWQLTLQAHAPSSRVTPVVVGMGRDALEGLDELDREAPPPSPNRLVQLAVVNRDWARRSGLYRRDLRSPDDGHVWDLEIRAEGSIPIALFAARDSDGPPAARIVDRETGAVQDLDSSSPAFRVLAFAKRPYRLALLAGSHEFVDREGARMTVFPPTLVLDRAAPNPFRPATRIRFGLPRPQRASLFVYDVTGRRVASPLRSRVLSGGFHTVLWTGVDDQGRRAASGMYVVRLVTEEGTRTRKVVLLR